MIPADPALSGPDREAVARLVDRLLHQPGPPLTHVIVFGSRARGDAGPGSDLDLLLVTLMYPDEKAATTARHAAVARRLRGQTGVPLETWTVAAADLRQGRRTPMLVDALEDGRVLWPPGRAVPRAVFTPADASFCAARLLEWVAAGGRVARDALRSDVPEVAAARARDDITRMATAALLLTGETRHRRASSLLRFEQRFVDTGFVSPATRPALRWALRAYPPGKSGRALPPATPLARATALEGYRLAGRMQKEVVPWIRHRMADLRYHSRRAPRSISAYGATPPPTPPPPTGGPRPFRRGTSPSAAP